MSKDKNEDRKCSICEKVINADGEKYILVDKQEILCIPCFHLKYSNNETEH